MCISYVLCGSFLCRLQFCFAHSSYARCARRNMTLRRPPGQKFQLRALVTMKSRKTFSFAAFFISSG